MTDRKFLNKNRYAEVNPYNQRNYDLGNSSLENDVIVYPQIIFKNNKYILKIKKFKKMNNKNKSKIKNE